MNTVQIYVPGSLLTPFKSQAEKLWRFVLTVGLDGGARDLRLDRRRSGPSQEGVLHKARRSKLALVVDWSCFSPPSASFWSLVALWVFKFFPWEAVRRARREERERGRTVRFMHQARRAYSHAEEIEEELKRTTVYPHIRTHTHVHIHVPVVSYQSLATLTFLLMQH